MKFLLYSFFLMFLSCQKDEVVIDTVFLEDPRLKGSLESFTRKTLNGNEEYNLTYEDLKLVSFTTTKDGQSNLLTLQREGDKVTSLLNSAGEKVKEFQYTTNGSLKSIIISDAKLERIELNNGGKWEYYYDQEIVDGSTVYKEIRRYDWQSGIVKTQIINRPGISYEEEDFSYSNEANPFLSFFKNDWPMPLGRDAYFITEKMPEKSSRLFDGLNFRFTKELNEDKKLLKFSIEKQDGENWSIYETFEFQYFD